MSADACPAFAQELLLNWGSCSWCLPELCGRFSCVFFHNFLTPTHRPGFQAWAGTCLVPADLSWQSGSQEIQIICTHPALLTLWALLSWAGAVSLFLLLPAGLLETEAGFDSYRIIFLRWMLVTCCKFTQSTCSCSYQEVWAFSPDIQYSLNALHGFCKIMSFFSLPGCLKVTMETLSF